MTADVEQLRAALRESREANAALLRERNTWARQTADLRDDAANARDEATAAWLRAAELEGERTVLGVEIEKLREEIRRLTKAAQ